MACRAGYRCSKPDCGVLTKGAASDDDGTINIGFAAHITAASPERPRYALKSNETNGYGNERIHRDYVSIIPEI